MKQKSYFLFLFFVALAMLCLNLLDAPTLSDDMIYRFMWNEDESAPVETIGSLGDLFHSQWIHYLSVNGRWVVHVLAQFFLVFLPPVVLQVVNTLLFVLLIHLTTRWLNSGNSLFTAVMVTFLLFIVFQGLRTTMLWGLGSFNYLWVLVGTMTLLLWMRRVKDQPLTKTTILLAPLAFFVGCGHEALSLPLCAAFVVYLYLNRKESAARRLLLFMLWYAVGTVCVLASPGIWNRSAEAISLMSRFISGAVNLVFNIRVLWLLLIALMICWRRDKTFTKNIIRRRLYAYIALLVAVAIVVLCGTNLERVCFFVDFIAMTLFVEILAEQTDRVWSRRLIAAATVIMLLVFVPAYLVRKENYDNWKMAVEQMKEPGRQLIAVRCPVKGENRLMDYCRDHYINPSITFGFYCSYMAFDSTDINMRCAARLYDKNKLVFLPEDIVSRINTDSSAYKSPELCVDKSLYVWQLPDSTDTVNKVTFILNDEDVSQLKPYQRLLAYKDDTFELDDYHHEVVEVNGHPYLVFTCPTTNIFRRINHVEYE